MKIIVAHPSRQHSFNTAISLKKEGMLYKYITTVYNKNTSLTGKIVSLLRGKSRKKGENRYCKELEDVDVIQFCEELGLLRLVISKFHINCPKFHVWVMERFAKKVAKYVIENEVDGIIVFDGMAKQYLDLIKKAHPNIKIFMDVTICSMPYMKHVFEEDMACFHHKHFYKEEPLFWDKKIEKNVIDNFTNADYLIAPSAIVKESLLFCGIPKEKILMIPYGVSLDKFPYRQKKISRGPLKLLYMGNVSYRKGMHHLLNVLSKFSKDDVILNIAGGYNPQDDLYQQHKHIENINFLGFVTKDVINDVLQDSDVFVLPSLAEGLAIVILESLASGLPVICTERSGGNDAITNYENGIVVKAGDEEDLYKAILWMRNNREKLPALSLKAHETAKDYTWDNYSCKLVKTLKIYCK